MLRHSRVAGIGHRGEHGFHGWQRMNAAARGTVDVGTAVPARRSGLSPALQESSRESAALRLSKEATSRAHRGGCNSDFISNASSPSPVMAGLVPLVSSLDYRAISAS